jgi:hypothetical protein
VDNSLLESVYFSLILYQATFHLGPLQSLSESQKSQWREDNGEAQQGQYIEAKLI